MKKIKDFFPTSWSIDNKTSIYVMTVILTIAGVLSYNSLQKENFPDIVIPTIITGVIYPGTSPSDMENLVTRPIEKEIKSLSGVKKVTSNSMQDFCMITVEFNTDVAVDVAKQKVKDAVDKAKADLPQDMPNEPDVQEVSFSEFPIMYINLSGDYSSDKLKQYAEAMQDRIEALSEINRVDIVGALEQEVQINVDMYKMQAAQVTFGDIQRAIASENMTMSGGLIAVGEMKRAVRVVGQYTDANEIGNIVVKSLPGANIPLREIATVVDGFKEKESYARLDGKPVITLNVIKRSGMNLIEASDKINAIVKEMQGSALPKDLKVTVTGDQSTRTRHSLNDLINTIIIGFILVTVILMFFMGTTNALFVGLSVPISMFVAFIVLSFFGISMNMIVLFAFLLALGIVVDDAIVVIENTHRIHHEHPWSIVKSAKAAAGEVFVPVLAGTLTTVAPFAPLLFWPGIVGEFMYYLPVTLIITLMASLLVAFIINPVFAVSFMGKKEVNPVKARKTFLYTMIGMAVFAGICYLAGFRGVGNLTIFIMLFVALNKYVFTSWINSFQTKVLPKFMNLYERTLRSVLKGSRPWMVLGSIVFLLILSVVFTVIRQPKVDFFPSGDPNFVYAYLTLPVGTDQSVTDSLTKVVEQRVNNVIGKNNPDVESVIANVAIGAGDPTQPSYTAESHKGKVTVAFVEFMERTGPNTKTYLNKIRESVKGIPGVEIIVDQEQNGPPVGKPISIEVSGEDFGQLIKVSKDVEQYINSLGIAGIEDLRTDLEDKNPQISVAIDRVRANREGISTAQIAIELRTAIFGTEASKFKRDEDEYPIQVRYAEPYRKNIDALMDMRITFRDMSMGGAIRQIPLSSVAKIDYSNTFGGIRRKNLKRVITLSSNVLEGYNANEIVGEIQQALPNFKAPEGYEVKFGGQQEDQKETSDFLGVALISSIGLIFLILVTQFNSVSKPLIILSEIVFSLIGVLLGFSIFNMNISIVMTGVGVIALAGIVVKNGILLVEFADVLREREGYELKEAVVMAGKTRLTPVILTATAAILGLIPLAIGLNLNFFTLFSDFEPHFFLGGDSVVFWGPLAWTIIFGLSFATILTLLVVPAMYLISERFKLKMGRKPKHVQPIESQPHLVEEYSTH
ncbi:efflux RND transporter permease subunit [Adhaeribacter radiodurans]|uniref:Efflux RND transporter permease subunit n=1 Tax=Adhaeribacter radiodurans TaxID=2745197 RepID=A0A7L7LCF0_9BACT|nr:efflux RND transporter permease subunit [Adhaeribacter radiodurans]QMU30491.1 efflux RND transporter permease subunit [Adhaeribacter radiodurans]